MATRPRHIAGAAAAITVRSPDPRAANGIRTAIFARAPLVPGEDATERQNLTQAYLDSFEPRNQVEVDAILAVVDATWRLRRLSRADDALRGAAQAKAGQMAPQPVAAVANAIRVAEIDVGILQRVLDGIVAVFDPAMPEFAQRHLTACAVVVDRILETGDTSVADMRVDDAAVRIGQAIEARTTEITRARQRLTSVTADHQPEIDGHLALASLLDERVAARLARERSSVERSLQRALDTLQRLRGGAAIHVLVAATGHFAEANPQVELALQDADVIEVVS